MAGIEEVRARIAAATEKLQAGISAVNQATLLWDEGRTDLSVASQGSGQPDASDSMAQIQHGLQLLAEAQAVVQGGIQTAQGYAARL
jgi:hypothetical protein